MDLQFAMCYLHISLYRVAVNNDEDRVNIFVSEDALHLRIAPLSLRMTPMRLILSIELKS